MRNYVKPKDLSAQIKAGLQICSKVISKDKHSEKEYRLFSNLAELYLHKGDIKEYPKVAAIYQYLKKLVEKHLHGDKEKLAFINEGIKNIELRFLRRVKGLEHALTISDTGDIESYKEGLVKFREGIKKELVAIENLGIEKDKEELNEGGLRERATQVENMHMKIREFFIGTRKKIEKQTQAGLVNWLIKDCIIELGGLPRVGVDNRECAYAIFGMGSLALGTMTPWSDLEFGILIEEGLTPEEEDRVKEYFRLLTILLHIQVVNFGETPLRMMGIKELNNFKAAEKSDAEHNWFFDNLTNSGFSFDGPHWHACKTPYGREKGYRKPVMKEVREGLVPCNPYELIGTVDQFMSFYQEASWGKEDPQLVQGLGHIVIISGVTELLLRYQQKLEKYKEAIESLAFNLLKEDGQELDPFKQIGDPEKEGHILKVKKEIYRFPDRMIVALGDCLEGKGISSWELIRNAKMIENKQRQDLQLALSIATELRLRTYVNNNGQKEDLSVLTRYESQIKELRNEVLTEEVFYLKDIRVLYRYYHIVSELSLRIGSVKDKQSLVEINKILITQAQSILIRGYIYKRFLKYYDAIKEFELLDWNDIPRDVLANLYREVGRNEEALRLYSQLSNLMLGDNKTAALFNNVGNTLQRLGNFTRALQYHQESLKMRCGIYKRASADIATSLNNIGATLESLGRFEEALRNQQKSLEIRSRICKSDHAEIAACLINIGNTLEKLGRFETALQYKQKSLEMSSRIYKGDHTDIAASLNNIGNTLESLGRFEEALQYKQESLEMRQRVYKDDHIDIAASLNNMGNTLERLGRFEEALQYMQKGLEMRSRIHKGNHTDIAGSLNNTGNILEKLGRFEEALQYMQKSFDMRQRIYKGNHTDVAASLNNIGGILERLGKFEKALSHYQKSLEMNRGIHEGDHADIATSLNNIGSSLERLGKYEEALQYKQKSLEMRQRIYHGDHADIATSLNNIANTLESMEKHEEALTYHQKSLEMRNRVYKSDHADIAASLNNIGNILEKFGRFEEALRYKMASLKMIRKMHKNNHINIAKLLNNIGISLAGLERFEEALQYTKESLEMKCRIYKNDHIDIAESLNNMSVILQNLGMYKDALNYTNRSINILRGLLPSEHKFIKLVDVQFFNCNVALANQQVLLGYYDKAIEYYTSINIKLSKVEALVQVTYSFASQYLHAGELNLAISCYEALSEKLLPKNIGIKHNLACIYHIKAVEKRNKCRLKDYQDCIRKVKETFGKALNLETNEEIHASLHTEYAMFLLMNHDLKDKAEYTIITANTMAAIGLREDGSELSYGQIEKAVTIVPIQELLSKQNKVIVKPYLLSYYLLVKVHCLHDNREQAEEVLKGFRAETQLLKGSKDGELAQYLFDWGCRELESHKLQQVIIAQVTEFFESGIYTMTEGRNITTVLSQSLPYNHIGIIWDYYSECRIMGGLKYELRQVFNSVLASSSEALRQALGKNDTHIDIVIEYIDEELELLEDYKTRVMTNVEKNASKRQGLH